GTTQVLVDPHNAFGITMFSFPPSSGVTDVGDLWVGPTQVTLTGKVLDSTNLNPVSGAGVSFGGRNGVTADEGSFNLAGVAYSDTDQAAFWGIAGGVRATGYFFTTFSTAPNVASAGVVALPDILITPSNDPNPPPPPGNIQGRVLASPSPSGALVSLSSGATIIRVFNVGSDGSYFFWVPPGSYTISFAEGALTAPDVGVTVASQTDVVHVPDVTLH
ncbi:MAG: hypothetical protein HY248_06350, partial [Fimbriimonas ginsengisoli]|nr:hypothetical protein [Fimbriimonas ginsengisoli]